ncbi:zinc-binding dehydrogenase [Salinicoccus hispanicus]|uniref:Zinc-binding dehydrogenase n=1 Tax=Salinicoccus hispanicus TaxID=157225 RepID=A0A6N8U648_9STAP|nr:zinc-binding dehydrogenase [Salinicoccus hispanicus]MXQ51995.1 zinc-binding dehydrogenase [Salinicoccus hispanicus]
MKAWQLKDSGSIDNLEWKDVDDLHASSGELLVKVFSTALNPVDYQLIESGHPKWNYPHIPGVDLSGEVLEVGEGVEGFEVGERVAIHTDMSKPGAFAEQAVVNASAAAKIPDGVSFDEAAAILCAGMTAYQAVIQKLNAAEKETILVHGGSGGVGGFAVQLAKKLGHTVFTTASKESHDRVKALGADLAIDYKDEDVTNRIMEETEDAGVDLIFNTVSSEEATADLDRLAFSGQLAYIAGAPDTSDVKPFTLSPSIHEVALGAAHASGSRKAVDNLAHMANELMARLSEDDLDPVIDKVLSREALPEGLKMLKQNETDGKVIVRMQAE